MHITTEEFDRVIGGLSALVNVLSNRLKDKDEKLDIAKTLDEELRQENNMLRDKIAETLNSNQGIKEEVDRLQRVVDHYQSATLGKKNQILEGKKQALKLLKNILPHFGPEDKSFASGFENAIAHLEGDITRNSCTSQ